ncbi:MAG: transcription/translation regulatory transformer protein RfaH [Limnohabitans sp.]
MTSDLISTQQAADRLGLTTSALHALRCRDDGLSIVQKGFSVGYRLEDVRAFEQRQVLAVLEQVLTAERPLPLIRAITAAVMSQPASAKSVTPAVVLQPLPAPTSSTMTWYLIYTKPRQEAVALTNLSRQGFECYLPMLRVEKIRHRKTALVAETMFPRYLFIRLDTSGNGQSWSPIRSTLGVNQMVKFGGHPAKVDAQLVDHIRFRETSQPAQPMFTPGEHVVVADGPFAGLEAIYQTTDAERRSMILLEILCKPVHMRIDTANLRKTG